MKKFLSIILAMFIALVPMFGCNDAPADNGGGGGGGGNTPGGETPSSTITLSAETLNLSIFGETTLTATVEEGTVNWNNGNSNVISVVENGNSLRVIAIGSGSAVLTATLGSESATCIVSVSPSDKELALSSSVDAVEIREEGSLYVPATVIFDSEEFTKATINYTIEDTTIASVQNGTVTGIKAGNTVLKVVAEYYGRKSNEINIPVTVKSGAVLKVNAASVELYAVKEGSETYPNSKEITVKVFDGTAEHSVNCTANIDDPTVATFENGVIKVVDVGTATITLSCEYGGQTYTAFIYVKVLPAPEVTVKLNTKSISIYTPTEGQAAPTYQLSATVTVLGKTVSADSVKYSLVSGSGIITVSQSGLVTSVTEGTAVVRATYVFQGTEFSDECTVIAKPNTRIYYGQHEKYAVSGAVAKMTEGDTLVYNGINNLNDSDTPLIRFQIIQQEDYNGQVAYYRPHGVSTIFLTIQEADNPSNYVTVLIATIRVTNSADDPYFNEGAKIAARVSAWGNYTTDSAAEAFYAVKGTNTYKTGKDTEGWVGWDMGIRGYSFYNAYLKSSTPLNNMISIAIEGSEVFFHINGSKQSLINFANSVSGQATWSGFSSTSKLNVYVKTTGFGSVDYSDLVVASIGGQNVTADTARNFSLAELGNKLVP